MSPAVVSDQKPSSSGYSVMRSDQCTGHSERMRLKKSCGGPSAPRSRSPPSAPSSSSPFPSMDASSLPAGTTVAKPRGQERDASAAALPQNDETPAIARDGDVGAAVS